MASADAETAARVGIAEALAIEEQVRASGGPRFQMTRQVIQRFSEAIETAKVDVVPRIVMTSGGGTGAGMTSASGALEALLALTLSDRVGDDAAVARPVSAEADAIRKELRAQLGTKPTTPKAG